MSQKNRAIARVVMVLAPLCGQASLLLFVLFLFSGPFKFIDLGLSAGTTLVWDGALSLLFFIQHSGMIRKRFRLRLAAIIPIYYLDAAFTIVSSMLLTVVVICWQPAPAVIYQFQGLMVWLARGVFFLALVGFGWGVRALKSFDPFGCYSIRSHLQGHPPKAQRFQVYGPYLWVRHPLYFFVLVLIWSCPHLTTDRLLFNVLWSLWIYWGTVLEEKDLVAVFGQTYREYQKQVPMLIPFKRPWLKKA